MPDVPHRRSEQGRQARTGENNAPHIRSSDGVKVIFVSVNAPPFRMAEKLEKPKAISRGVTSIFGRHGAATASVGFFGTKKEPCRQLSALLKFLQ